MDEYTLYLDESTTHSNGFKNPVFCLAGIAIKRNDYDILQSELNALKIQLWSDLPNPTDLILHEKEVREVQKFLNQLSHAQPHYQRFRSNQYLRVLYDGLQSLLKNCPCYVFGSVIQKDRLCNYYPASIQTDEYLTAMQIIMENFSQFLNSHQAIGHIVMESRSHQDKNVRLRYNHLTLPIAEARGFLGNLLY